MRLAILAFACVVLAACSGFEPRVSVETREPPTRTAPAAAEPPARPQRTDAPASVDYVVARGDTLYGIAFRNKLDFRDLAAWNRIAAPYTIYPGQTLRLSAPTRTRRVRLEPRTAPAVATQTPPPPSSTPIAAVEAQRVEAPVPIQPVAAATPAASSEGSTETFAVVDSGAGAASTSALIETPVPSSTSASIPTVAAPAPGPGSPAAAIGLPATPPKPTAGTPATSPPGSPPAVGSSEVPVAPATAGTVVAVAAASTPEPASTAVDTAPRPVQEPNAPTRARDGLRWRWPANGALIGRFSEGDPTQQGIDIGGSLGQAVLAAADGEVVYSGNGLIGYGELVIVQHSPGFLSAYGHNQKRLVLEGSKVKAGQPIAEMGRRGGIDMLHFEIRRNGKPVDPLGYLPPR